MLRMLWIAAYDISDDRARRRLEKRLLGAGVRAQYSVFETWLSQRERDRLQQAIDDDAVLQATTDSLRWYGLCGHCQRRIQFLGRGITPEDPSFYVVRTLFCAPSGGVRQFAQKQQRFGLSAENTPAKPLSMRVSKGRLHQPGLH